MSDSNVLEKWNELKALVEALDIDMNKNSRGNAAAGVRARKAMRKLQSQAKDLVKLTLETDKAKKENKDWLSI